MSAKSADAWLDDVATGKLTMSQRKVSTVETHCGIEELTRQAKSKGVHLLRLTDDKGSALIAASRHPFTVLA